MMGLWKNKHVDDAQSDNEKGLKKEVCTVEELEDQQITRMNALIEDLVERQNEVLNQLQERALDRQKNVTLPKVGLGDGAGTAALDPEKVIAERMQKIEKYVTSITPNESGSNELPTND